MGSNHELLVPEIPELPNMEATCAGRSRIVGYSTSSSTATSPSNAVTTRSSTGWIGGPNSRPYRRDAQLGVSGYTSWGMHLIGVYVTGMCLTGVHLMGVHLTGVHLIGMYVMGVHLIGVYVMGI